LFGNNVDAALDFVGEAFDFVAFDNVAWTLLVAWTGLTLSFAHATRMLEV